MDPLRYSRLMHLNELPAVIEIPANLDDEIRKTTTEGLQEQVSVERNCLVCFDGEKFYLGTKSWGGPNVSTTEHKLPDRVGLYHSHPKGSVIDMGDFNQMFEPDRAIENFSLVDGFGDRRTALFKTAETPRSKTDKVMGREKKHTPNFTRQAELNEIIDLARLASMGFYEGRGKILYRVYPKS